MGRGEGTRLSGVCASATKAHLGMWEEPGGRAAAFGHLLAVTLVNQGCPTNEERTNGILGTKITGGVSARGGARHPNPEDHSVFGTAPFDCGTSRLLSIAA